MKTYENQVCMMKLEHKCTMLTKWQSHKNVENVVKMKYIMYDPSTRWNKMVPKVNDIFESPSQLKICSQIILEVKKIISNKGLLILMYHTIEHCSSSSHMPSSNVYTLDQHVSFTHSMRITAMKLSIL
uniref:Uncharacterized protein n=1 Tax=Lactuca sativa TaxID=4236 RepID=A0A9R1WF68_LACSA|nr:hypothetical protein LSAT_V11C100005190 [Lactuca sativa]